MNDEDCEELDPGSGSVHSAGNPMQTQFQQRSGTSRIQNSAMSGQTIVSGTSVIGNEKVLPPTSLNLSSATSKYQQRFELCLKWLSRH